MKHPLKAQISVENFLCTLEGQKVHYETQIFVGFAHDVF